MPNGTAREWEEEWRKNVNTKLDTLTEMVQGLVSRQSITERTISDMRASPANTREWLTFIAIAGVGLGSMLCGGISLLVSLWPHIH